MDDDLDPITSRSVVGTAQFALWIVFCILLWVGSIISIFMRPGIDSFVGVIISSCFSGWVWLTFVKHDEK